LCFARFEHIVGLGNKISREEKMFRVNRGVVAPVLAEFFGTGILVMVALILGQTTAVSYFIATSLAVTAAAVYLLFNVVSGAHTNPAITFGMWTARRIGTLRGVSYIAAQLYCRAQPRRGYPEFGRDSRGGIFRSYFDRRYGVSRLR
jgi:hypothetical protein